MTGFARACLICGKRVAGGEPRCAAHAAQRFRQPVACYVCGRRGPKGACPDHDPWNGDKPEAQRLARQPWRAGYRRASYRKAREAAILRARGACEKCGRSDLPLETDHRRPLSLGSTGAEWDALNTPDNLAVLCVTCHRFKTRGA